MTTAELISKLQEADPDGTCEVRFVHQPEWPMAETLAGVWREEATGPLCPTVECRIEGEELELTPSGYVCHRCTGIVPLAEAGKLTIEDSRVLWLVGGPQPDRPYGPRQAFSAAR